MSIDKIKEYYAKERGFESWSEFLNNIHGFQIPSHMTEVAERYAQSQTQELTAWKQSASKVFKNLDLQAIGKTLGIGLGEDVSTNVIPKIKELQEQNADLVEMLDKAMYELLMYKKNYGLSSKLADEITELLTKYNHLNKI